MQSVWQHKDLHILVILIEALLDEKFNAVWMVSVKAADRIRADVKDDVFFSPVTKWFHHLLLEMLPFAMATSPPPPQSRWVEHSRRVLHVLQGRTHARVNAWVAN